MKTKKTGVVIFLLGFLAVSCRQDPIFFIIASETAPRKPRIEGAPTNMVVFERDPNPEDPYNPDNQDEKVPILYVASGRLHWYAKAYEYSNEPRWDMGKYSINQPSGKIISLAATSEYLYALCLTGSGISTTLRRIGPGDTKWVSMTRSSETGSYSLIQSIHADPDGQHLFAGARNSRDDTKYALLYLDNEKRELKKLRDETSDLSGAVYRQKEDTYYLSTKGGGIFRIKKDELETAPPPLPVQLNDGVDEENGRNNRMFMGMIKLANEDGDIIAVERNGGALFIVQGNFPDVYLERMRYTSESNTGGISTGRYATGALAQWEEPGKKLLIASIQGGLYSTVVSSYTHGYVEFGLKDDGSFNTGQTRYDPGRLQSIHDQDRYTASIGKHPINHLFQAPKEIDPNMTFFASTQTNGLWSYRNRSEGWQWNAEE